MTISKQNTINPFVEIIKDANASFRAKQDAFKALYDRYCSGLLIFIKRNHKDVSEAEDIVQTAFARAFEGVNDFDQTHTFSTWLYRIATNYMIDVKRKSKTEVVSMNSFVTENEDGSSEMILENFIQSNDSDALQEMIRQERIAVCRKMIDNIKNQQSKELVYLFYIEQLSQNEIQERTNLNINTIKVALLRGREAMKNMLLVSPKP